MSTSDMFSAPSSATGIDWSELNGRLLLVSPTGIVDEITTTYGPASAVEATVEVLDSEPSEVFADTLIFPKLLQGQVKRSIGGMVLGRLTQGVAKQGQSKPWTLADPTDADKDVARAYIAAKTEKLPF